jgi:isopentenyl diphosphate isomerase/L-lactate dehydrogenase-like FMN-dependent dehydrogenase
MFPATLLRKEVISCVDARLLAKKRLPWMVFDYIDGAAGEGYGEQMNRETMRKIHLQPRILRGAIDRSVKVPLLGQEAGLPFGVSPMGMCNLSAPGADLMLARLAAKHKIPVGVSTVASTSLETMIEEAEGEAWFQLYFCGDPASSMALVERCRVSGYKTLVVTVDVPEVGRRPRELRRGFKMPFKIGPTQFIDFALHPHWSLSTLFAGKPELANFGGIHGEFDRTSSRAGSLARQNVHNIHWGL